MMLAWVWGPGELSAQEKIDINNVPIQIAGAGLVGYVDFVGRAGCMGERRLQMRTQRVIIEGVNYNGDYYTGSDIPGYQFPIDISDSRGLLYVRGAITAFERYTHTYPVESGTISLRLEGSMDWLTMADGNKLETFGCKEWTTFVEENIAPASSKGAHQLVVYREAMLGDGLYRDLTDAIGRMEDVEQRIASLRSDLEHAETPSDYQRILSELTELERGELATGARNDIRALRIDAERGLEQAELEEHERQERAEAEEAAAAEEEASGEDGSSGGSDDDTSDEPEEDSASADADTETEGSEDGEADEEDEEEAPAMMTERQQQDAARRREIARQSQLEEEQRRRAAYARWKEQQNEQNAALAGSAAASSAAVLYFLGEAIYSGMGTFDPEVAFDGTPSARLGLEYGYSFMLAPMYFNSSTFDGVDSFEATEYNYSWPVNFDLKAIVGYESENFGAFAFGEAAIGTTIVFNSYLFPAYDIGAQIYGGHSVVQGFLQYSRGGRQTFVNHWYVAGESGTGKSAVKLHTLKLGAKFTWDQFERKHMRIGLALQGLRGQDDIDVQRLEKLDPFMPNALYLPGLFFELRQDHSFNFYLNMYPTYPFTGRVDSAFDEERDAGGFYMSVGFLRAFDGFL